MNDALKINPIIRRARVDDVPDIVRLLANDSMAKLREAYSESLPKSYYNAFYDIDADKNNYLIVVEHDEKIMGTAQLTILTHLTYQGGKRGQIEGVRIDESYRGQGIGHMMIEWCIQQSRELGCHMVQLTMDKKRLKLLNSIKSCGLSIRMRG